ncbi:hypothetical protein FT643_01245 [Ketobacter sp. MCCC 1A13808]|uniref:hypothetical protein n=1 Tax=Ketobacter sp. MCCC 1A13808 TaxID=2602738 RepID=UPI000F0DCB5D|nr:hypothetical protein [Ketobacter sp. MCCC 1A13808]MVF10754.1 hypothetical protein [Ketobacter sp. MCCC 1A13808]RLP56168.1 MAG: hypothetical protein D6160_01875 [Ketobacter sp.]
MKLTHAIVFGLLAALVLVAVISFRSQAQLEWIADHGMLMIVAIGVVGLVGARQKAPASIQ